MIKADPILDDKQWYSDILELLCKNGECIRVAFALDCGNREIMGWVDTTNGIDAVVVKDLSLC